MTSSQPETGQALLTAGRPAAFAPSGPAGPVLFGSRCRECGAYDFPPGRFCPRCSSRSLEHVELSRTGTLHSWSTVYQDPGPSFVGDKPYTIVTVELPEGVRVVSTLAGSVSPGQLRLGLPLNLTVVTVGEDASGRECYDFRFRIP